MAPTPQEIFEEPGKKYKWEATVTKWYTSSTGLNAVCLDDFYNLFGSENDSMFRDLAEKAGTANSMVQASGFRRHGRH